ncbi:hypothetical protein LguiA_020558 [Lonicera macranthoides]
MGDRETVVASAPTMANYRAGYSSAPAADGDFAASTGTADGTDAMPQDANVDSVNMESIDVKQETLTTVLHGISENPNNLANTSVDSSQPAYDSSVNGNDVGETRTVALTGVSENGVTSDDVHQSVDGALFAEEERLWSIVRANSLEFNAWTALIEETEKMAVDNVLKIRKVYDAFLAEFPLCYGYWKKYADHEARLGSIDKVVEVYERAVQGVTYSVDIWLHYCVFSISTYGDPDIIRRLFERGLAYVGTDYLSFPLWDKYIEFEYSQQEWSHLAMIYTRILENPNQQIDRYFNSFRELVASRPLSELRTAEEAAATAEANSENVAGQEIEGEGHPNTVDPAPKPVSEGLKEAEELEKYMAIREEMYKKAKEFDSKIIGFETAIRRPYFHVRPLNITELENWHNYLDFIEGEDDFNKVVKLYERCLIACANYPEYWIRYVLRMEASGSTDLTENALARATQVFVKVLIHFCDISFIAERNKRQPEIHLFAARFREQSGDIPGARAAYQLVHDEISPGLLEAIIKHANMEHRLGNLEDACSLYELAIEIEKGKEHSQTLSPLFAQYSRFLYLVSGKGEKAREILDRALENNQLSKPLLEAVIHFESIQSLPKRIDYLDQLVEKFIVPSPDNADAASVTEREELSSIFLELVFQFLDLFGNAQSIKKADDRHAKLFLHHKSALESKKRNAEDYLVSEKVKLAKAGVVSSAPSVMGAYQSAQNHWASYSVQPQAWPQVTQAQGQQYNSGYTQQAVKYHCLKAAYGTYNYGSSYTQPQIPTSTPQVAPPQVATPHAAAPQVAVPQVAAPQVAAYAAYPTTYPVQAEVVKDRLKGVAIAYALFASAKANDPLSDYTSCFKNNILLSQVMIVTQKRNSNDVAPDSSALQAVPQLTYGQPAAATASVPPQAYYGTYY